MNTSFCFYKFLLDQGSFYRTNGTLCFGLLMTLSMKTNLSGSLSALLILKYLVQNLLSEVGSKET